MRRDAKADSLAASGRARGNGREPPANEVAVPPEADANRKREATAIARLAIHRGHVVHQLRGGEYLVEWRGCTRHCRDLAELEQHARRVGAA